MKLLLAVDGSVYTRRMLQYIVSNELLFRPSYDYVLLHVQANGRSSGYAEAANDPVLSRPVDFLQTHGFQTRCLLRSGRPADELVQAASQLQSNLVIMGCRGQSALQSIMLGSVTAEVLARSHVPVLVVR